MEHKHTVLYTNCLFALRFRKSVHNIVFNCSNTKKVTEYNKAKKYVLGSVYSDVQINAHYFDLFLLQK